MKKLLLLPITLPLAIVRGAVESAVRTAADALMDLTDGSSAEADVYVPEPVPSSPGVVGAEPPSATAEAIEDLIADLEDEDVDVDVAAGAGDGEVVELPVTPEPGTPAAAAAAHEVAEDLGLEAGHTDEEPDTLVESEGAADPGAQLRVDEPWPGYGQMRAPDVVDRLRAADPATKAIVRLYEQQHRKRSTVLAATDG